MSEMPEFNPSEHVKRLVEKRNKTINIEYNNKKVKTNEKDELAHKILPSSYVLNIYDVPDDSIGLNKMPCHIEQIIYIKNGFEYYLVNSTTDYVHISGNLYLINIQMCRGLFTIVYVTFPSYDSSDYSIHYPCNISDIPLKYYKHVVYNQEIGSFTTKTIGAITDTVINELGSTSIIEKSLCYNFILAHITSKCSRHVRCHGYFINGKIVIKKTAFSIRGADSFEVNKYYIGTSNRIMTESKSFDIGDCAAMIAYVRH